MGEVRILYDETSMGLQETATDLIEQEEDMLKIARKFGGKEEEELEFRSRPKYNPKSLQR
jgi:hypothetical protein